jgi:hypothetical protein
MIPDLRQLLECRIQRENDREIDDRGNLPADRSAEIISDSR